MFREYLIAIATYMGFLSSFCMAEDFTPRFDAIFDMPSVQSIVFDSRAEALFVVADSRLMRWELDPLRLSTVIGVDTVAHDLAVGPSGVVYAAGQRWDPESFQLLGGSALGFVATDDGEDLSQFPVYGIATPGHETGAQALVTGIAQFSSIAFDNANNVILASPVDFSITILPDRRGPITEKTDLGFFELGCGTSVGFSVTDIGDFSYYFSSTTAGAVLEIGRMPAHGVRPGMIECFRVANIFSEQNQLSTVNPVQHAIVDLPIGRFGTTSNKAVLVLEPNTQRLHLFGIDIIEGELVLPRASSETIDLSELVLRGEQDTVFTKMSATADGAVIYLSGPSTRTVLRLKLESGELREHGRYLMPVPVRRIAISDDGAFAAIVTGEEFYGGDQIITIITSPAAVSDRAQIPVRLPSVRLIQEGLNEAGFRAGLPDGIPGPRTRTALVAYLETASSQPEKNQQPLTDLIESMFPTKAKQYQLTP